VLREWEHPPNLLHQFHGHEGSLPQHHEGHGRTDHAEVNEVGEERGKSTAQVAGSVITYLRRYALAAILGIYADEDTDGNGHEKQPQKREVEPASRVTHTEEKAPSAGLLARWGELCHEAQGLGIAVAEISPDITEAELTSRGKALAAAIKAAKA